MTGKHLKSQEEEQCFLAKLFMILKSQEEQQQFLAKLFMIDFWFILFHLFTTLFVSVFFFLSQV